MSRDRIINLAGFSTIFVAFSLLLLVLYWVSWPFKTIEFNKVTAMQEHYHSGDVFDIKIEYCKYTSKPAIVTRQFIGDYVYSLPELNSANANTGCGSVIAKDINIPEQLDPGKYMYKQTVTYKVNPLRSISVTFEVPLDIVGGPHESGN